MSDTAPGDDHPFNDPSEIARLLSGFEDCSLPKPLWTHRAHLAVALYYCERLPHDRALELMRDGIRRYNLATGGANTEGSGYHETITRFYVWLVDYCVRTGKLEGGDLASRVNALVARYGARDLPLQHWSRERLMSVEARREWVEPDLLGLPDGRKVGKLGG
jgi:hypothetical protein